MAIDEIEYSKLGTFFVVLVLAVLAVGLLWMSA